MKAPLTFADYVTLPDDGRRYEIHDGELSVTPAPGRTHQRVVLRLAMALDAHVTAHALGEVNIAPFDVVLSDPTTVQPDILFVAVDRSAAFSDRGFEGAPTLVVEVLSPSTAHIDRHIKRQLYVRHAVPYYWIVDPEARTIDVHRLTAGAYGEPQRFGDGDLVDLPPFPGLTLAPATVWL
ncbi:MAG: Uma2 family endonuclease [Candidatus Rokubacteria bacterium]|nr:Uma2 family endonuclease [Candidatus Rokubacteria bacterium]